MGTLLPMSTWSKISVFRKKMAIFSFKRIYIEFFGSNERLKIDACAKFKLPWAKDNSTELSAFINLTCSHFSN